MKKTLFILIFYCASISFAQNDQAINYKLTLAQNYEAAGQFDKAEPLYKELYQLQPHNYTFFESLNKVYISQKKYNESILLIEDRIKQTPLDANLFGMLGSTYYLMNDSKKAGEVWNQGIATNPNNAIVYRIIANYAIENRAYEKAIQLLSEGKKKTEDAFIFSLDLANIYAANMNFEMATTELCNLLIAHPDQIGLVRSRISSFITRPLAAEQTIKVLQNFSENHSSADLLDLLSFSYLQTGNTQKAFETVQLIEKKFNGNGTNMFVLAQNLYDKNKFASAANAFKFIIDNYPRTNYAIISSFNIAKCNEQILNQRCDSLNQDWKPIPSRKKLYEKEYLEIISQYSLFIKNNLNSGYNPEAYFRIGEIYRERLTDFSKADSVYSVLISRYGFSIHAAQSKLYSGIISITNDSLENAKLKLEEVTNLPKQDSSIVSEAKYYLAKIDFWRGDFFNSILKLKEFTQTLSNDFSNDAIELLFLINIAKKDSINLIKYANADLLLLQNKLEEAATEFKTLADNDNLFIINQFAKEKLAEIFLSKEDFSSAVNLLESITKDENIAIFVDKSTFLLGLTYLNGLKDVSKAKETFQKILEKFPNSIYFDRARDELNSISTKNG